MIKLKTFFTKQKNKIIIFSLLIIIIVLSIRLLVLLKDRATPNNLLSKNQNTADDNYTSPALALILKKCDVGANVPMTECLIEQLDRVAAEREWKQRKLESLKHPQINTYNMISVLEDEQVKISEWRNGFEDRRDKWCNARYSFTEGSGIPAEIATCQLELELLAIKDLNNIYYDSILNNIYDSQGISDFEPKETDINKLIKTNLTSRGCIWAGEENCDGGNSKADNNKIINPVANGDCFKYVDIPSNKTKINSYLPPVPKAGCIIVNTDPSPATVAAFDNTDLKPPVSYGTKMLCPCNLVSD